jgi:type II secretory pathway pseudopilin PulG
MIRDFGRRRGRQAFTLLEILVVMVVLAAIIGLIVALLWSTIRVERADAAVMQRLQAQSALADQFREDVARASDAPEAWEEYTAGPHCLILKRGDGGPILYRWEEGRLERIEHTGDGESLRQLPVGGQQVTVEFTRGGTEPRLLALRLLESREPGPDRLLEIAAALGGDLR